MSPVSVQIPQLYLTFHMLHKWLPLAFPRNMRCVSALLSSGHVPSSSGWIFTLLYWNRTCIVWIITCSHPQQKHLWLETCEIIPVACKKGLASFWGEKQLEERRNYTPSAVKVDTKEASVELPHYPEMALRWWMNSKQCYIFFCIFLIAVSLPKMSSWLPKCLKESKVVGLQAGEG